MTLSRYGLRLTSNATWSFTGCKKEENEIKKVVKMCASGVTGHLYSTFVVWENSHWDENINQSTAHGLNFFFVTY